MPLRALGVLPPGVKPTWDDCGVQTQAQIVAFDQTRAYDESEREARLLGARMPFAAERAEVPDHEIHRHPAPRIDLDKYRRVLDRQLREDIAQAIMQWLEATVLAEVPVWSGASRATFLALARNIEYNIPISPVAPSRVGRGMAESSGSLETDAMKGRYVFNYSTTLPWLCINECRGRHAMGLPPQEARSLRLSEEGRDGVPQVRGERAFARSLCLSEGHEDQGG